MSSPLVSLLLFISLISLVDLSVEAIRHDIPEDTGKESEPSDNQHFRQIPVYPVLRFGVIDNTPADSRFRKEIGRDHALEVLENATYYVQSMFRPDGFRRGYLFVELTIENFRGSEIETGIAASNGTKIRLNSAYVENFVGDVKYEFIGVIFHESAKMRLQTTPRLVPRWILSGAADFVRLKAGWPSRRWPKMGSGTRWTDGYAITAYFLEYCSRMKKDFVSDLISMMEKGYRYHNFVQLLGKDVDELWNDYKSLYGAKTALPAPSPSPRPVY